MPGVELLKRGDMFLLNKRQPDSALICYTVVAERYEPGMNKEDIQLCLEGYYGRWQTFFFGYGNPSMAMEDLSTASRLAALTGKPAPKLDFFYAICYMSIGTNVDSDELYRKALDLFSRSFDGALKNKDYRTLHRAYDNMVTAAYFLDSLQAVDRHTRILQKLKEPEMWRRSQSLEIRNGFIKEDNGDLKGAAECFQKLIDLVPHDMENMRYMASFYMKRARVEMSLNEYEKARCTLDSMMHLSYKYKFPDIRQSALWGLRNYYEVTGQTEQAAQAHKHYIELKDTLASDRFMAGFQELSFANERRKMQRDMEQVSYRSRLQAWLIGLAGLLLAVTLLFVIVLKRSNRKLQERSEMLYRQLQDTLTHNDDWIKYAVTANADNVSSLSKDENADDERSDKTADEVLPDDNDAAKYSGSGLTDVAMDSLSERIREVILHSTAIYDPDFSLGQLAEEVGSNRKYVSQCINDRFGCNFWTLVNQARIREAMLRLNDTGKYGNYSIEGIAESVGFRSRSSFTSWFKRFTGLGAAEYRQLGGKIAVKNNLSSNND